MLRCCDLKCSLVVTVRQAAPSTQTGQRSSDRSKDSDSFLPPQRSAVGRGATEDLRLSRKALLCWNGPYLRVIGIVGDGVGREPQMALRPVKEEAVWSHEWTSDLKVKMSPCSNRGHSGKMLGTNCKA